MATIKPRHGDGDGQALAFCCFEEEPICRQRAKAARAR